MFRFVSVLVAIQCYLQLANAEPVPSSFHWEAQDFEPCYHIFEGRAGFTEKRGKVPDHVTFNVFDPACSVTYFLAELEVGGKGLGYYYTTNCGSGAELTFGLDNSLTLKPGTTALRLDYLSMGAASKMDFRIYGNHLGKTTSSLGAPFMQPDKVGWTVELPNSEQWTNLAFTVVLETNAYGSMHFYGAGEGPGRGIYLRQIFADPPE